MSNADGIIVPIVEGDQGEGYQDIVEDLQESIKEIMSVPNHFLKETIPKSATECRCNMESTINALEKKLNRIMIHLGIDDKNDILVVK